MDLICGSLDLFAAAIIAVLLLGSLLKEEHPKPFGKKINILLLGHIVGLLCDSILWFWHPQRFPWITISFAVIIQKIAVFIAYGMLIVMTIIYTDCLVYYIREKVPISKRIVYVITFLCSIVFAFWTISVFNGMFFTFEEKGMFAATKHYWMTQISVASFLCVDLFLIIRYYKEIGLRNAIPLLSYILLPIIGFLLSFWWDVTPVYLMATFSMLLMFIVFHLEQDKQLREQERQLTQSRIAIMLTQIQPHFIYNTLTAICGLCDENPMEAKKVTAEFADYLRHNLESLKQSTPVSFEDELRHTQVYLTIEQKRFEEKLKVIYDIEVMDFRIPALTVQPLVENAVKHGVTKRKEGGTVTLSTRDGKESYEIKIVDNGVGFPIDYLNNISDYHIGIQNVKNRLWSICQGTLVIRSEVGQGTVATIMIPKSVL